MLEDIERVLEERIASIAGESVIGWWGRPFEPVHGVPYLLAEMTGRAVRSMALGASAPELWEGYLQLTIAHPASDGMSAMRARVDVVRDHFPRGLNLTRNAATVIIMERNVQPTFPAIDWLNTPVIINWICEEVHT